MNGTFTHLQNFYMVPGLYSAKRLVVTTKMKEVGRRGPSVAQTTISVPGQYFKPGVGFQPGGLPAATINTNNKVLVREATQKKSDRPP